MPSLNSARLPAGARANLAQQVQLAGFGDGTNRVFPSRPHALRIGHAPTLTAEPHLVWRV